MLGGEGQNQRIVLGRVLGDPEAVLIELEGAVFLGPARGLVDRDANERLVRGVGARQMRAPLLIALEPLSELESPPPFFNLQDGRRGRDLDRL